MIEHRATASARFVPGSAATSWSQTRAEWAADPRVNPEAVRPWRSPAEVYGQAAIPSNRRTLNWGRGLAAAAVAVWAGSFAASFEAGLTVLNLLGLAAAAVGIRHPGVGLVGIGLLCTLEPVSAPLLSGNGLWRWNTLNYWLLIVLAIFLPWAAQLRDVHSRLLQVLVLLLVYGLFWSPDRFTGVQYVFAMVTAFGVLLYCARATQDAEAWFWLGMVSGIAAATGCLAYFLHAGQLSPINPNIWCLFPLTALFAISLSFPFARSSREQLALGILATINFGWTFLSTSRGGALTGAICVLFLLTQTRHFSRKLGLVAAGLVVCLALLSAFDQARQVTLDRFGSFFDTSRSASERTSNRSDLALAGWKIFEQNPMGVGTAGFSRAQSELALFEWSRKSDIAAHSGWIRVLAENGIPGAAVLAAYVLSFAWVGWRRRRRGLLALGLFVTAVFCINQISYEFEHKGIWLLAAGAAVILHPALGAQRRARAKATRRFPVAA